MSAQILALCLVLISVAFAGCLTGAPTDDGDDGKTPDGDEGGDGGPVTRTWAEPAKALLRPGAPLGDYCTFNWLFTADNGSTYIGTAAHCTGGLGERVTLGTTGAEIGAVVYDSDNRTGADALVDFSLILLDPDQVGIARPLMIGFDGPSGAIASDEAAPGDRLALYGHGMVLGDQEETRSRNGALVDEDGKTYRANLPAVYGDSGGPLVHMETGKAFGIISNFGFFEVPPSTDRGPTMPFIFNELTAAGFNVTLATA